MVCVFKLYVKSNARGWTGLILRNVDCKLQTFWYEDSDHLVGLYIIQGENNIRSEYVPNINIHLWDTDMFVCIDDLEK